MKIAHVTATFPPYFGGTGSVCYQNALRLARLGHEVTVITPTYPAAADYADPPEFQVRRCRPWFRVGNAPFAPGMANLTGFDLVHLHYPFYFGGEMVWLASLLRGIPYVITYHQDVLFATWLRHVASWHHRLIGIHILRRARYVMATSLDYARASRLAPLLRARPDRVGELPNGIDVDQFRPELDGTRMRAAYGLQPDDRVVLFVGALDRAHYFKGVQVLLNALASYPDPHTRLLIVGDGDLRASYEAQARALHLSERVTFCGRVPGDDLPYHYATCDVLALPSLTMGEAFGVVLLEAMACGKPVIASNLPGVRSVVNDGQDGLLVEPGRVEELAAAINRLASNPSLCREMGRRGRVKVESAYAWDRIIPRLEAVYQAVLKGSR